jgi:hypothetical protein
VLQPSAALVAVHRDFLRSSGKGRPTGRANVLAFVGDVWDLASEDPDPVRWAECFIEAGYARVPAG